MLPTSYFGYIDTSLFLTYAVCEFATGMIGDRFHLRKVLTVSFFIQSMLLLSMSYGGYQAYNGFEVGDKEAYYSRLWQFMAIFACLGFIQSVD